MKLNRLLAISIVLCTLLGCESSSPDSIRNLPPELRQSMIVAVTNPSARIPASGTFSWAPGPFRFDDDPRLDRDAANAMIQDAIRDTMGRKGFTMASSTQCDLLVGYHVVLGENVDDALLNARYGYSSGWSPSMADPQAYPKGTLIMDIVEARTRRPAWRGSLQTHVDFELGGALRKQRISRAVEQLLANFPPR